jgi:hypothetical protein
VKKITQNNVKSKQSPNGRKFAQSGHHGANATIASYNASVVNFYNAMDNIARFENKKYFLLVLKTL